jgi:hypothetical protein
MEGYSRRNTQKDTRGKASFRAWRTSGFFPATDSPLLIGDLSSMVKAKPNLVVSAICIQAQYWNVKFSGIARWGIYDS